MGAHCTGAASVEAPVPGADGFRGAFRASREAGPPFPADQSPLRVPRSACEGGERSEATKRAPPTAPGLPSRARFLGFSLRGQDPPGSLPLWAGRPERRSRRGERRPAAERASSGPSPRGPSRGAGHLSREADPGVRASGCLPLHHLFRGSPGRRRPAHIAPGTHLGSLAAPAPPAALARSPRTRQAPPWPWLRPSRASSSSP